MRQDASNIALYGQDSNPTTWAICKMNMFLHNINDAQITLEDTLQAPQFVESGYIKKFDLVIANPPFSQNYSRANMEFPQRFRYGFAPEKGKKADLMFAQHMIPHHQQAIEMSDMLLAKQGIDPRVSDLAKQIKAAQGPEIQQMQGWLTQWGNPPMPPMPSGDMPGHGNMPGMTGMPMPTASGMPGMSGMMSDGDMAALRNAQGVEASKLFLTQMIAHHEGAITMAQNEIKDGRYAAAVELARSIVAAQQREIETMKGILATL